MDREWMRRRLEKFAALCQEWEWSLYGDRPPEGNIDSQINAEIPTVKEIFKRLDPDLIADIADPLAKGGGSKVAVAVEQALGILRDQDEWRASLAPDAPSLVADSFHPVIWNAASTLWGIGKYRLAVQQACLALSVHIAVKAGSPLTERALVSQVFSKDDPRPGQVRLHIRGDKAAATWRSRQEGLHLVAQGAFAGIRNVTAHTDDEWTEQVALEQLAVLSVIARWTDETELVIPLQGA